MSFGRLFEISHGQLVLRFLAYSCSCDRSSSLAFSTRAIASWLTGFFDENVCTSTVFSVCFFGGMFLMNTESYAVSQRTLSETSV